MIGAIAGDVIGSVYEKRSIKTKDFPLFQKFSKFTDDSNRKARLKPDLLEVLAQYERIMK